MVVIYPQPLSGSVNDELALVFPGPDWGSAPVRVIPDRVGDRTLVFNTPGNIVVYVYNRRVDATDLQYAQSWRRLLQLCRHHI